jgi:hypothetical protein
MNYADYGAGISLGCTAAELAREAEGKYAEAFDTVFARIRDIPGEIAAKVITDNGVFYTDGPLKEAT